MTESMVERVARALYEVSPEWDSGEAIDGHQVTPPSQIKWETIVECNEDEPYREAARAAIAAMREPTEEMLRGVPDWDRAAWLTMIGVAFSDHQDRSGGRG